jgi:RimJ/RimL family protein N-acetyltransferase
MHDAIRTERLLLRPLRPTDAEALFTLFASWEVIRWLTTPPWPYTIDDAQAFIAMQMAPDAAWRNYRVIALDGSLIGGMDAPSHSSARPRSPALGYWLGQPYWGRGYMTEAARAFIAHLFASGGRQTIYSGVLVGNDASLRVQEKLGFERTGEEMVYHTGRREKLPLVRTQLARARFLTVSP